MKAGEGGFYITLMTTFQPVYQVTDHTKHVCPLPKAHCILSCAIADRAFLCFRYFHSEDCYGGKSSLKQEDFCRAKLPA